SYPFIDLLVFNSDLVQLSQLIRIPCNPGSVGFERLASSDGGIYSGTGALYSDRSGLSRLNPEKNSRNSQNASERHQPKCKIRNWIAAGLFPKPIVLTFLFGAFIRGLVSVGISVIERQENKNPKRKSDQTADRHLPLR